MTNSEFGLAAVYRVLKKSGANRVGDEAVEELRESIEQIAESIAKQSVELAQHAGRKTIKTEDIKLATKMFLKN
jgi:histone H3/H4|tara:strand:- start:1052 stop:1273 length:222 start_codon:yes stop_codon:yes gene_type:complete